MNIIVLGAGLVGAPMALDLQNGGSFRVSVADIDPLAGNKFKGTDIRFIQADLSDPGVLSGIVQPYDLVLSAVPGHMGYKTLETVIVAGKNAVDIAFFPEDLFNLDPLCKQYGVTVISDIGVAPGMSNILVAYSERRLDELHSAEIYVGGLPKVRTLPWEYKAVFSPIDVIEEYTRPARYVDNGQLVIKPALTDPELLEFEKAGTLEAFNSDGLRSLIKTVKAPYLIEKTLRYPGHIDKIKVLKESGFFSTEMINVNGAVIRPLDFTTSVLFPKWKLEKGEEDITVMKVIVKGVKEGKEIAFIYELYDEYNATTGVHSMARTTGYTATMAVRMLAEGLYAHQGISPPEYIGRNEKCVHFIMEGLKERGVVYNEKILA